MEALAAGRIQEAINLYNQAFENCVLAKRKEEHTLYTIGSTIKEIKMGSVKVLLSGSYNNFQCERPLPEGASDEEYRIEFSKARELAEDALQKHNQIIEVQEQFRKLASEYIFLAQLNRDFLAEKCFELTREEAAAVGRFERIQTILQEHTSQWDWEDRLSREAMEDGKCKSERFERF